MTRLMYDGIDSDVPSIPADAQMVAGYVDGLYAWPPSAWARFPGSVKVRIAVFSSTNDGHVLDVEPGNATPAQAVDWVLMRRSAGADPTVYCSTGNWPTQRAAFQARNVAEPHYWVAQYDNIATIPAGAVGKQYADNVLLQRSYDLSVVADYWPGVDPVPAPAPAEEEMSMIINNITGSPEVWALSGSLYWHVADVASLQSYRAAGVPQATVSLAEHNAILAVVAAQRPAAATVTVDASQLATALAATLPKSFTGTLK